MSDLLDERMPPYDGDAEKAVVGSILIDGDCIHDVGNLEPQDFFTEQNRTVFKAMVELGDGINQVTVARALADSEKLEGIGGIAYLSHLVAEVPTSVHCEYYSKIVKNLSLRRRLITAGSEIIEQGFNEADAFVAFDKSQTIINKLTSTEQRTKILMPDEVVNMNVERYEMLKQTQVGLKTGLANYDDKMGGLLPGEYTIIAGPTTIGKTTFARQWCRSISASHYALWVALEMTPENLMDKDISALSGVPVRDIVRGRYGEDTYAKMGSQFETLRKLKLYTASGRVTTKDIRNYIRRMLASTGLSVVFIDYIQLLSDKYGENNNARIGYITKELENTCKEFRVPIVGLSQLSRAPDKRPNKRPITGDLRDSGDLEHSADTIVFLYSPGYYDSKKEKSRQISECIIAKNRLRGFTGRLWLRWNAKFETNEPVRRTGKDDYADYRPEFEGIGEGYDPGPAEPDD